MMILSELFMDIKGYEGSYQISNLGRVKSFLHWDRDGMSERVLKPFTNKLGYQMVYLYKDGKSACRKVHRLVMEAFVANPENKPQVNHLDFNKRNNAVYNLEWCDALRNSQHKVDANRQARHWLGKKMPKEICDKMSENRRLSGNVKAREAIDLKTGQVYACGKEAAISKGICYGRLKQIIRNPKNKYGIIWLSEYEKQKAT